jgi:hypothetical protein
MQTQKPPITSVRYLEKLDWDIKQTLDNFEEIIRGKKPIKI